MFIKRLKPNTFDVFIGNGWDNWTRVVRFKGDIQVIAGNKLNRQTLHNIKLRLVK